MIFLLKLVARGNAIITELNRLIELVPAPFKQPVKDEFICSPNQSDGGRRFTLDNLISDFRYFKNTELFESNIENNEILKRADEKFCNTYFDTLTRFYLTFESVQRYANELNDFTSQLDEEIFVGQNIDSLLLDNENRQLLCEAYFLLGYMLITTDNNFEGGLRERLIVSYYRYSSYKSSPDSSIDETCNLMRSTGFKSPQQQSYRFNGANHQHFRPEAYPESFFSRLRVNQSVVKLMIAKLQSVDIYNQTLTAFPHPDHRSIALSKQASMLYVVLYFCPDILNTQRSRMREITDKFFHDNWVISIYIGEIVNLIEAWSPYKAARESLSQLLEFDSIRNMASQYNSRFSRVHDSLKEYLREGYLSEDFVLEHYNRILNHVREANVVLKWMLLQSQMNAGWQLKLSRASHSLVMNHRPQLQLLFEFLQILSDLEKRFLRIFNKILDEKSLKILECKGKTLKLICELIDIFSEVEPMRWIRPGANSKLVDILTKARSSLSSHEFDHINSRDFVLSLTNELNLAQDSYSDGKNMQVVQLFKDTKDNLLRIFRFLNISDEVNDIFRFICDFSYGWKIIDENLTNHMQSLIKDDPHKVYGIEATFLKLATAFDTGLMRISQSDFREDFISVSQYYSTKLVSYIRDVLHVIPASILESLSKIVSIQTEIVISDMPSKVSLESLRDFALPDKRIQILKLTYKASHYAESMLLMQSTNIGSIKINSKQLLEDGIRRELVIKMSDSIQEILEFSDNGSNNQSGAKLAQNLLTKLAKLDAIMNGYKCSLEYVQDYLFIYGLKLWQEELDQIVKLNVERSIDALLSDGFDPQPKVHLKADIENFNSSKMSLVTEVSANPVKSSFVVRILNEVLRITDPRSTIYDEQMNAWYNQKNHLEKVMDSKVFELIASSLCATGLNGLDQVCCTLIKLELEALDTLILSLITSKSLQFQSLSESLSLLAKLREQSFSSECEHNLSESEHCYRTISSCLSKIIPYSEKITNNLLRIGQLQAIRTCISYVLSTKSRYDARNLYNCLDTLNTSLLSTLRHGKQHKANSFNRTSHEIEDSDTDWEEEEVEQKIIEEDYESDNEHNNADLEDSQLIFELSNHLEWIGLSDPMNKIYTLAFQTSVSSQVFEFREKLVAVDMIFLVLLDQCSKFQFSSSIGGFLPRQSRSFYETTQTVDGQPFLYGLVSFIYHYKPFLDTIPSTKTSSTNTDTPATPLVRLLEYLSLYVRCSLGQKNFGSSTKSSNLTHETSNVILAMIEIVRLSRQHSRILLSSTFLPQFILDTFQFSLCHLNKQVS